ncbi:MAG: large subunit ribosomal protein [Solirubrobacteraceae bacterium]|jgi:ribosomal protein L22|nr:large subunit ribosomal protein [Solirubrobacteraceae bacterium]
MSPSKPGNPSEGKPDREQTELEAQEAKEAVAQEEAVEAAEAPAPEVEPEEEAAAPAKPKRARRARTKGTPEVEEAAKAAPRRAPTVERPVVRAQARYVRTSARKARLVCDLLRGKSVQEARAILAYSQRSVARDWAKVLESAIANAEHNHELVGDDLRILTASADEGPTLKRFRPRAMGRATRIRKRTSHLTITLTPKE